MKTIVLLKGDYMGFHVSLGECITFWESMAPGFTLASSCKSSPPNLSVQACFKRLQGQFLGLYSIAHIARPLDVSGICFTYRGLGGNNGKCYTWIAEGLYSLIPC